MVAPAATAKKDFILMMVVVEVEILLMVDDVRTKMLLVACWREDESEVDVVVVLERGDD
jgi:hypothetical protein